MLAEFQHVMAYFAVHASDTARDCIVIFLHGLER